MLDSYSRIIESIKDNLNVLMTNTFNTIEEAIQDLVLASGLLKPLEVFRLRLKRFSIQPYERQSRALRFSIKKEDYIRIQNFIKGLVQDEHFEEYVQNKKRFIKEEHALPRTLQLLLDEKIDSAPMMMMELKRKTALGTKNDHAHWSFSGSFKKGKNAFRVDTQESYVHLIQYITENELDEVDEIIENERLFTDCPLNQDEARFFIHAIIPELREKKHDKVVHGYYKLDFYALKGKDLTRAKFSSFAEKLRAGYCILRVLNILLDNGFVNCDLKLKNFIYYNLPNQPSIVKNCDLGLATKVTPAELYELGNDETAKNSFNYASPEIYCAQTQLQDDKFKSTIYWTKGDPCELIGDVTSLFDQEQLQQYIQPHAANEVWAAGVCLFELFSTSRTQTRDDIEKLDPRVQPIIAKMLCIQREDRASAKWALDEYEKKFYHHIQDLIAPQSPEPAKMPRP